MSSAIAEDFPERVKRPVADSIMIRQKTQKAADKWAEERTRLQDEYEKLEEDMELLTAANQELNQAVRHCRSSIAGLERKIVEIERITNEMSPFLEETFVRLAAFVNNDVPFLKEERARRLDGLRRILDDPLVSISEKFRKVMEALSVEAEYGNTVEVFQERIAVGDKNVQVDIFRLGRLSLFFRTLDLKTSGFFDPAASKWKELPSRYNREINAAVDMGAKRRSMDLLILPLGKVAAP
jgi:hypothetical protein